MLSVVGVELFLRAFSIFKTYDDIGYLMMTLKQYSEGHPLYDAIYTQYGPAYYVFRHWLLGQFQITHDFTALVSIGHAVACCLLLGLVTYRITSSVGLCVLTIALAAGRVGAFLREPGHPQEFAALLVTLVFVVASWSKCELLKAGVLGVLVASIFLTKINIGVFILLPLLLYYSAEVPSQVLRRYVRNALVAVIIASPFLLMRRELATPWVFYLATLLTVSLIPLLFFLRWPATSTTLRHSLCFATSMTATGTALILHQWFRGSSFDGMWHGIVAQHLRFDEMYANPFRTKPFLGFVLLLALASFLCIRARWRSSSALPLVAGLYGIALSLLMIPDNARFMASYSTPFLWLVPAGRFKTPVNPVEHRVSARLTDDLPVKGELADASKTRYCSLLFLSGVFLLLQSYPGAGTQVYCGTLLFPVVAAVGVDVFLKYLADNRSRLGFLGRRDRLVLCLVAGMFLWNGLDIAMLYRTYRHQEPVDLRGMSLYRLPADQISTYRWLVSELQRFDTFVSMPGFNSLYFWTGKQPPSTFNVGAWMMLLDNSTQQQVVEKLSNYRFIGGTRNREDVVEWVGTRNIRGKPLVEFMEHEMKPVAQYKGFEILERIHD